MTNSEIKKDLEIFSKTNELEWDTNIDNEARIKLESYKQTVEMKTGESYKVFKPDSFKTEAHREFILFNIKYKVDDEKIICASIYSPTV